MEKDLDRQWAGMSIKSISERGVYVMKRFLLISFLLLFGGLFFIQCNSTTSSSYKFVVLSHSGKASGYYIVDQDDPVFFAVNTYQDGSTSYYKFSQDLDSPSSVTIHVDSDESTTSSIIVYIYSNDAIVQKATYSPTSTTSNGTTTYSIVGDLSYTFSSSTTTTVK